MTTEQHTKISLKNYSQVLCHVLGKFASAADWPSILAAPFGLLHFEQFGDAYLVQGQGFSLHFVFLDDDASSAATDLLGLQSCQLYAHQDGQGNSPWLRDWPLGLEVQDLSKAVVMQTMGQPVVDTRAFALFECEVTHHPQSSPARTIGVQCDWTQNQQLASLTLLRLGEFEPLSAFEFEPQADSPSGGDHVALDQPLAASAVISCRSGELTPKTGMYEGLLPTSHPLAASYNKSNMRFYFSQEGKPMIRMGMPDSQQESLVVWIWRASSVQDMR